MIFNNVLNEKCPPFQRDQAMIFFKTFKVLPSLIFLEKDLDMMFYNVLSRKKGFSTEQKCHLNSVKMSIFPKMVNPSFSSKKDLYTLFNYILNGKEMLSRLQKCQSNIV